jgi:hypothetical protein
LINDLQRLLKLIRATRSNVKKAISLLERVGCLDDEILLEFLMLSKYGLVNVNMNLESAQQVLLQISLDECGKGAREEARDE